MTPIAAFILAGENGPSKELEETIATDPYWSYSYARYVLKAPFPTGEVAIAKIGEYSYQYSRNVLRSSFPQGEDAISNFKDYGLDYQFRFDRTICSINQLISHPLYALSHAISIRNRFPEGEPVMKKSPRIWKRYNKFLKEIPGYLKVQRSFDLLLENGPSKELEFDIIGSPEHSYYYAVHVLKGPFIAGEKSIARDPEYSFKYAANILKSRFKAGEAAIATDSWTSLMYAHNVINGPFPAGELAISKNDYCSLHYALDVLNGRFLSGELAISRNIFYSLKYAENVIKGAFPLGEHCISKDVYDAYFYTRQIIKSPLPECEITLARSANEGIALDYQFRFCRDICSYEKLVRHPSYALSYAIMKNSRFPEGEPAMSKSPRIWKRYQTFVKEIGLT